MARLYVVSGPSGCGKSTLCGRLLSEDPMIRFSVSATTRAPREGEVDGVDYFFITNEEYEELVEKDAFYEHADNFTNRYGTLKQYTDSLTDQGFDVILDIDVQGAVQVRSKNDRAVLIFIMPPSLDELKRRLISRNTESEEQLQKRLGKAEEEMSKSGMYDHVIVNDDLERAYEELKAVFAKYRKYDEDQNSKEEKA